MIREIFDYISKHSKRYAENQVKRIKARTSVLKINPEVGRIVPEIDRVQIREIIEGNYRIVYRVISADLVEILTVHHSSRDFGSRDIK